METMASELNEVMGMYDRIELDMFKHTPATMIKFSESGTNYVSQAYYMKQRVISSQLTPEQKKSMNTEMDTVNTRARVCKLALYADY